MPALTSVGIKQLINGPESFTPDGNFILGEAPEVRGFFVGAGFNAFGIASAGGAGRALAEWIESGEAPMDLWAVDIRRFGPHHRDIDWVRARTLELYAKHYSMPWPYEEHQSSRPCRTSQLYKTLGDQHACFGEKMGWERPNWFAPQDTEAVDRYSFGRQNWFEHVGVEHQAVRESVGVFDQSSFAKFELTGPHAERALSWIASNHMDKPVGKIIYTQMLNAKGGIECDLTVSRFADELYYIVTGTGFRTHDYTWIKRQISAEWDARLTDVTDERFTLTLMGPRSREVLSLITKDDLTNETFPFAHCREININGALVRALRITYAGELGWELHGLKNDALLVYQTLMEAGSEFGIVNAGYRAIESLRLEKGYRSWGADIGPDFTPLEAGLGWAVKHKSNTPFLGREALLDQLTIPLKKRLVCFTVDDPAIVLLGRETILREGQRVGWLASGGWGYTVKKNIGYGYVRHPDGVTEDFLQNASYELEVATRRVPCQIHTTPLYDAGMTRVRG